MTTLFHDGDLKVIKFRKVSLNLLGERTNSSVEWLWKGIDKLSLLGNEEKVALHGLAIKYISLSVYTKNTPLTELYQIAGKIADTLKMENPFELFCTHWGRNKYLGFYHVSNLTFLPLLNRFSPFEKNFSPSDLITVFDEEISNRQMLLIKYLTDLTQQFSLLAKDQEDIVCLKIQEMESFLNDRDYEGVKTIVLDLQPLFSMENSLFSPGAFIDQNPSNAIDGIFNAVVSTFFLLKNPLKQK